MKDVGSVGHRQSKPFANGLERAVRQPSPDALAQLLRVAMFLLGLAWLDEVEYGIYALPRPALTILLDLPARSAQDRILQKDTRSYTERSQDMLEADTAHIAAAQEVYRSLVDDSWHIVDAARLPEQIAECAPGEGRCCPAA